MVLPDVPVRLFFFYLVMSWKKGYYNKDLIGRHIMLKSWSKIQNKVRIEENIIHGKTGRSDSRNL